MLKNFKKRFILAILGLGIFMCIVKCIVINNKTNNTSFKENEIELIDESIISDKEEENNQIVEEKKNDTKEITSKTEENEDLSINQNISNNQTNTSEQKTTINQNINTEKKSNNKESASTQIIEEKKQENVVSQVKDEPKKEQSTLQNDIVDNSVDTNSLDYNEHRGRIDCYSSDECMNISLPIQFRFSKSITYSQYIDVMSKSDKTLGYFIEYMFQEYTYSSSEECENMGREIKQTLKDKVISYQCNGSTLKIYTSY